MLQNRFTQSTLLPINYAPASRSAINMLSYLDRLLSQSPIGADPDRPCYILALPQELRDAIYSLVIEDEIPEQETFLWLSKRKHQGRVYAGIPHQIKMACCNHQLHFNFAKLLVTKYPVGATLSLDDLYYFDLGRAFSAISAPITSAMHSLHIIVLGGVRLRMPALLQWSRLFYDGPLARDGTLAITYDMNGCWDRGYDPCGDAHNCYIELLLKDLRALALSMKDAMAEARSAGFKTETQSVLEFEQAVLKYMHAHRWRLPATASCRGCSFDGVRFEHDKPLNNASD